MNILTADNLPIVKILLDESIAEHTEKAGIKFVPSERILATMMTKITEKRGLVLVDNKDNPTAFIMAQIMPALITYDIWCGVVFLFVSKSARGLGTGKKLLEALPLVASALGATKIMTISHAEAGEHASHIYDDLGYLKSEVAHVLEI